MMNENFDALWLEIESKYSSEKNDFQRMICTDLVSRIYLGITDVPSRRFISIEIPKSNEHEFKSFEIPQGFTVFLEEPNVKHDGYVSCILEATISELNDVFTVVVSNILFELRKHNNSSDYVIVLKERIEKWREFFRNPRRKKLSDTEVIGLIGEVSFLKELYVNEMNHGIDLWNGPVKSAQDFQGENIAVEIKASCTKSLESVRISSEIQLDFDGRDALFLAVYSMERNDNTGVKLPLLINETASLMNKHQKDCFLAKLLCLGYSEDDADYYSKGYIVKEPAFYQIKDDFPRLTKSSLPKGIFDIEYGLSLSSCNDYKITMNDVLQAVKEYEHG